LEEPRAYELKGVPAPVWASSLCWRELEPGVSRDQEFATFEPAGAADRSRLGSAGEPAPENGAMHTQGNGRRLADRVPLPRILAAYLGEPLIGRDREIGLLREATAPCPGRRAVLVLGEPGIGKTRHAAAAAAEAHAQGAVVVLARCPSEATIAFEPWVRAIGELALAGDDAWRATLANAAGVELSALVPELGVRAAVPQPAA
jgi:hypothetical protein